MNATSSLMFEDRADAGRHLATHLIRYAGLDPVVLALSSGGVLVAAEIARELGKPLDILCVRKLCLPGKEETVLGAIAPDDVRVLRHELISQLGLSRVQMEAIIHHEAREIAHREVLFYRCGEASDLSGRTVILVDDGASTGSSMFAAIQYARLHRASNIIVAVPVLSREASQSIKQNADETIAITTPDDILSVSQWYEQFGEVTDREVIHLLAKSWQAANGGSGNQTGASPSALHHLRNHSIPLTGATHDYDQLLQMIGNASVVLLGAASHGTAEFYQARVAITKRLILEKGFTAVAVEGGWSDAYQVNRYVRGDSDASDAADALEGFSHFPSWLWRNTEMVEFVEWMHGHNAGVTRLAQQIGFYGLDLYTIHKAMDEVVRYLDEKDPDQAAKAKLLHQCIDRHGRDPQNYGLVAGSGVSDTCIAEVIQQLVKLRAKEAECLESKGRAEADQFYFAEQNARLVRNAEQFYREMFRSDVSSWNLREKHLMETLVGLISHQLATFGTSKVVVWAHNSHLGDGRATESTNRGEYTLGQLVRQAFPYQSALIGFTSYSGTVTASAGWHLPPERMKLDPAVEGSYEHLFHQVGTPSFWLDLTENTPVVDALRETRLERAIGVVCGAEAEVEDRYIQACLPEQFDAIMHYDVTSAVKPLDRAQDWATAEAPETFPVGL